MIVIRAGELGKNLFQYPDKILQGEKISYFRNQKEVAGLIFSHPPDEKEKMKKAARILY
jgi:hypothetical protein